jgi:predicted O-methyltransferase YrrM
MNQCTLHDQAVKNTLATLHAQARGDWKLIRFLPQVALGLLSGKSMQKSLTPTMLKNAYIPVSAEQGRFLYSVARTIQAPTIVEFGSSFGIGTIYLAAAAKDSNGKVITTEIEPHKCRATENNLKNAGLAPYVTLLEGNALQTLRQLDEEVDLLFLDGWKDLYNDVLDLMLPKLSSGAVVIGDNVNFSDAKTYLERVRAQDSMFVTSTVNKATAYSYYLGT